MAERKPISKKMRFEVFKRDKFTCQYCGAQAPEVVLEVDHIVPISQGGTNDIMNLVTSCFDCNRGKGKKVLSDDSTVKKAKRQADMMQERKEQVEMIAEWQQEMLHVSETELDTLDDLIQIFYPESGLTDHGRAKYRRLIKRFSYLVVYNALEKALTTYSDLARADEKVGGICYNISSDFDKKRKLDIWIDKEVYLQLMEFIGNHNVGDAVSTMLEYVMAKAGDNNE